MGHRIDIALTAPFQLGDVVADLSLADGSTRKIVLREGRFEAELPAAPTFVRLTHEPAPEGEEALRVPSLAAQGTRLVGDPVEGEELFERGVRVPEDGVLHLCLIWGVHCHRSEGGTSLAAKRNGEPEKAAGRFLSSEHVACAERIGMDVTHRKRREVNGVTAPFHAKTLLHLGGKRTATFGQIIALAGDFYAYLDEAARKNNPSMWPDAALWVEFLTGDYRDPPLLNEREEVVEDIVATFDRELAQLQNGEKVGAISELIKDGTTTEFPVRRYLALAGLNYCHFGAQPYDGSTNDGVNEALTAYRYYHSRALAAAEMAGMFPGETEDGKAIRERKFLDALTVEAFGCHFLTDLFASGHLRVPRRELGERFGIMRGGLGMAHDMHDEDNKLGLWVTTRVKQSPRVVWRAFGDGQLFKPGAEPHAYMVKEAVRRSVDEVFLRFCGITDVPEADTAEALLPVALASGTAPRPDDVLPRQMGTPPQSPPNHFPLYTPIGSKQHHTDQIARRVSKDEPQTNLYVVQDGNTTNRFALPTPPAH